MSRGNGAGHPEREGQPLDGAALLGRAATGTGVADLAPTASSAVVTGWKKVSPPEVQSPLPPEVRPMRVPAGEEGAAAVAGLGADIGLDEPADRALRVVDGRVRPVTEPSFSPVVLPMRVHLLADRASAASVIVHRLLPSPGLTVLGGLGRGVVVRGEREVAVAREGRVLDRGDGCAVRVSDHCSAATPQWPAVRKPGLPPSVVTLKPSEQREPPPKMASPPSAKVLNSPAELLDAAMSAPRDFTVDSSASHRAPLTVRSAVTWIWLVFGLMAQAVPGMVAFFLSVVSAAFSASCCSWRPCGTAPAS